MLYYPSTADVIDPSRVMARVKSGEEKTPMIKKLFFFQRLFKLVISQMWV